MTARQENQTITASDIRGAATKLKFGANVIREAKSRKKMEVRMRSGPNSFRKDRPELFLFLLALEGFEDLSIKTINLLDKIL